MQIFLLQSEFKANYLIGYVLEDFRCAKNCILFGASSTTYVVPLPPPGKAHFACGKIVRYANSRL